MTPDDRKKRPERLSDVLASFLEQAGLTERVAQAGVIQEWAALVGPQIAAVTDALFLQQDGTLVVAVKTHGWMTELSLLEPELMRRLNADAGRPHVSGLRWTLRR
ncbi:MAG: DUF721 domain-containing protein [Gemmatimonas sp.]